MKRLFSHLFKIGSFLKSKKTSEKDSIFVSDYKQTLLIKQGREQFVSLVKKGLGVPVVFL